MIRGWDLILPGWRWLHKPQAVIGVVDARNYLLSGDGTLPSPGGAGFTNLSQSAIIRWGWGFYTVSGGIDPKDYRFRPRFVGVVDVRNDL